MGNCEIHERNKDSAGRLDVELDKTRIASCDKITGRVRL